MAFKEIAEQQYVTVSDLATSLNAERQHPNLSSAIRLFVLNHYREKLSERERPQAETDSHSNYNLQP